MKLDVRRFAHSGALVLAFVGAAAAHAAEPTCLTLTPDPTALEAARAALNPCFVQPAVGPRLAAATASETVLDKIDVMLVFDQSAQRWAEGEGWTVAEFATNAVVRMNDCLEKSNIEAFRFRLVDQMAVAEDVSSVGIGDILTNCLVNALGTFVGTGALADVASRRKASGADLVFLLYDGPTSGTIGLSYQLSQAEDETEADIPRFAQWAYGVCSIQPVAQGWTLAHEAGHMMGCGHPSEDVANSARVIVGPQYYSYSAGYYFWIGETGYFTVMSYPRAGKNADYVYTASPYFSSPDVMVEGVAVGTASHDNRRTLLNTYRYVAQYCVSKTSGGGSDSEPEPETQGERFMGDVTYNGYVTDANGAVAGTLVIAAGKGAKKPPYTAKLSVQYTPRGGKKEKLAIATSAMPVTNTYPVVTLPTLGDVRLYRDTVESDDGHIWCCRDYLKDKTYKKAAESLYKTYASTKTFVAHSDLGVSTFSVVIDKKGKGKLSAVLADGTKVSASQQGILTANKLLLPFAVTKGTASFGFMLTVSADVSRTATVTAASPLLLAFGQFDWTFSAPSENFALADGIHRLSLPMDEVKIALGGRMLEEASGFDLTPTGLVFSVKGKTWNAGKTVGKVAVDKTTKKPYVSVKAGKIPQNLPQLKFTFTPKTGAVKGSFNIYTWDGAKVGTAKVSFTGLVTGGTAWCTATCKKPVFSFDLTISD